MASASSNHDVSTTSRGKKGFGRYHHQENIQFCRQARGSLTETLDHFNVALDEGFMQIAAYEDLRALLESTLKILNGYIAYLRKSAAPQKKPLK